MASTDESQRVSGSSAGRSSGGSRRQNPQQQLSTIEKSVTHLLVATKQLLETLTMWSRGTSTESEVSDVYVRLGYEFNIACRAFNAIGVETNDLGPVPDLLRAILEDTLSQEASQASLDRYLPRIRDIIINLLHGLKKKQQRLRQRHGKEGGDARPPRQGSTASTASAASLESNLTQQLEDVPSRTSSSRTYSQRQGSGDIGGHELPPRTASMPGRSSPRRRDQLSPQNSMHQKTASRDTSDSTLSSNTMQNIPVIAPYPEADTMPTNQGFEHDQSTPEPPPPPPKPQPQANDALTALQKGGDLERRASRRFSAYQIQKHLGTSVNGIGAIPPAQHSPVPNRGRDVRESMNAVRSRGSVLQHNRTKSRNDRAGYEPSPSRLQHQVRRISEESDPRNLEQLQPPNKTFAERVSPDSPIVKTPEDKLAGYPFPETRTQEEPETLAATVNGPIDDQYGPPSPATGEAITPLPQRRKSTIPSRHNSRQGHQQHTPPQSQYIAESSPQPGKELTLFLQYKSKIKKFVLSDGADLSVPRLQLAFIEKFAWNTHNNGVDLPEIYIQDPVSGVRHELEDLTDIKERSVLVLNVEALDEVKRHFDDGIGGLRRLVEGIRTSVSDQQTALQQVSDRQQEASKEIASLATNGPAQPTKSASTPALASRTLAINDKTGQLSEIQSLRRDLAVVRQTYTSFTTDLQTSMSAIRTKAGAVRTLSSSAIIPDNLPPDSGRSYVNNGKKNLSDDSEKIVNRVDDLQDLVEDLRKDVVTRGVRPLPRQLESVSRDISLATSELKKLQEFLKREKPVWTKIWEKELQVVCDDRDLLTMQEELATDLEDDLEKAAATFALVEEATKQQNLQNPKDGAAASGTVHTPRIPSRTLNTLGDDGGDPQKAKDGVLGEVRALRPNHEGRLEAIERAEKNRQKELESRRGGEFQKELGHFVEEGRLKKSGGVEEVERVRLVKEEKARKENYERVAERERLRMEREVNAANGFGQEGEASGNGEVVGVELERTSSPEGFVDAKEDVSASGDSGPPA